MENKIKFEAALLRLEEIVRTLEQGVDELDTIVNLFEEGSKLADTCNKRLEKVENKIKILTDQLSKSGDSDEEI
ncbi:MAG: exodeoxyribonuclease VII small subunit [Candidatus Cloacimonetes bacterium]|nr:exodeoxyribonuclease VII small subunit [Candidatus Cloacimonadota bacterium]